MGLGYEGLITPPGPSPRALTPKGRGSIKSPRPLGGEGWVRGMGLPHHTHHLYEMDASMLRSPTKGWRACNTV